jgi:hypothetical protein
VVDEAGDTASGDACEDPTRIAELGDDSCFDFLPKNPKNCLDLDWLAFSGTVACSW